MTQTLHIGVLALQGDVREHLQALTHLGVHASPVRRIGELNAIDGLVIPGGESTTISYLLKEYKLLEPLRHRLASGMPAYGSCAGMVLLAKKILDAGVPERQAIALGGMDITVRRNAFGRQVDSFETDLILQGFTDPVHAIFIRAPWVEHIGPEVHVLARIGAHPVAVRQRNVLATAFHPEITQDYRLHQLFIQIVAQQMS